MTFVLTLQILALLTGIQRGQKDEQGREGEKDKISMDSAALGFIVCARLGKCHNCRSARAINAATRGNR